MGYSALVILLEECLNESYCTNIPKQILTV